MSTKREIAVFYDEHATPAEIHEIELRHGLDFGSCRDHDGEHVYETPYRKGMLASLRKERLVTSAFFYNLTPF